MATSHNNNSNDLVLTTEKAKELYGTGMRAIVGHGGFRVSRALMAVVAAAGAERTQLEETAGAEPVGEFADVVKEDEQAKIEATIKLVDRMNREMEKDESLRTFLMGLNNLILKAGKPIPRKILLQNGTSKKTLNRLAQVGFTQESFLRHEHTGALYTCIALPADVTFYGRQAVAVVREPDVKEDMAQSIRDELGGVDEVVGHMDGPAPVSSRSPVGD